MKLRYMSLALVFFTVARINSGEHTPKIAVAFDIHKVLVVPDTELRNATIKTLTYQALGSVVGDMGRSLVGWADSRRPYALFARATKLLTSGDVSGEGFCTAFEQHGYPELAHNIKVVTLAYSPVPGMAKLVQELKDNGVTVMVASNIGQRFYYDLADKDAQTKALFEKFDRDNPGITVKFINSDGNIIHRPIKKPDPQYFQQVKEHAQALGADQIFFLDDSAKYVAVAQTAGLEAFQFDATKHPDNAVQVLREEFVTRGILPAQQ